MAIQSAATTVPCSRKSTIARRPLFTNAQAHELKSLFKVLSNETRLRLLHALVKNGELCVSGLCSEVGMKPQAVSNQLQRLADRGVLAARREGNQVFYRIDDPCVVQLLDHGLCLMEDARGRKP